MRKYHILYCFYLISFTSLIACQESSEADVCQPYRRATTPSIVESGEVTVYWDVSKSMSARAKRDMPLRVLTEKMDNTVFQDVRIFHHILVGEQLGAVQNALTLPMQFPALSSNLPLAAEKIGHDFIQSGGVTTSILVSDMVVDMPKSMLGTEICGASVGSVPLTPSLFGKCLWGAHPPEVILSNAFVGAIRVGAIGDPSSFFVTIVSRDAEQGSHLFDNIYSILTASLPKSSKEGASEMLGKIVFLDFAHDQEPMTVGSCSFNQSNEIVLLEQAVGGTPGCRFRLRESEVTHSGNCGMSVANSDPNVVIGSAVDGILVDTTKIPISQGYFTLQITPVAGEVSLSAHLAPMPLTQDAREHVQKFGGDVFVSVAEELAQLKPPTGPSWYIRYEGGSTTQ